MTEVGITKSVKDYILTLKGLPGARLDTLLINRDGKRALVSSLEENRLTALLLDKASVKPGETFYPKKEGLRLPAGKDLEGRIINPLGNPLDDEGPLPKKEGALHLDDVAEGIKTRKTISEQLATGIAVIDALLPIGKGQKQAIFGEPRSGKTALIQDIIGNQKNQEVTCIYTAVGRPEMDIKRFAQNLKAAGALSHTIIISASPNEPVPLLALTPKIAFALANRIRRKG